MKKELFVYKKVHHLLVVVLKYASMALGAPSVVIFGTTMMPVLSVNNWDTLLMVIYLYNNVYGYKFKLNHGLQFLFIDACNLRVVRKKPGCFLIFIFNIN